MTGVSAPGAFQIPVPAVWRTTVLADAQRAALESVAAFDADDDPTGTLREVVDSARYALEHATNRPELTVLVTTLEEVHGADLGYTVSFPAYTDHGSPNGEVRRVAMRATVLPDLLVQHSDLPVEYVAEAMLHVSEYRSVAVIVGRLTMVDDAAQTVTVELFSKTDEYEVTVPQSIVLDDTALGGLHTARRRTLYAVLAREFGDQPGDHSGDASGEPA